MKSKKFDCVEMKNKIQEKIYDDIKDMSLEEENEYRRKKIESSSLAGFYKKLRSKPKNGKKAVS